MYTTSKFGQLARCSTTSHLAQQRRSRPSTATTCNVRCSSQPQGGRNIQAARAGRTDDFPNESLEFNPEDGIFPKRQPGQYPSVAVRKSLRQRFVSAVGLEGVLGRDSVEAVQANPVKAMVAADAEAAEYDPLRDGPLRYCGYANECGEAFAAWIPGWGVPLSYAVAITYVLVDTFDKYNRARKQARVELDSIDLDPSVDEDRCCS